MKTTIALFLFASLVASADSRHRFDDLEADPERGIVRLPRVVHDDGRVTMTYLNVSQIISLTIKTEGKDPEGRALLIIVSSEPEPSENVNQAIDTKNVTYEIRFPTRLLAEEAIRKMFAKKAEPAPPPVVRPPRPRSEPEGDNKGDVR